MYCSGCDRGCGSGSDGIAPASNDSIGRPDYATAGDSFESVYDGLMDPDRFDRLPEHGEPEVRSILLSRGYGSEHETTGFERGNGMYGVIDHYGSNDIYKKHRDLYSDPEIDLMDIDLGAKEDLRSLLMHDPLKTEDPNLRMMAMREMIRTC